MTSWVVGSDKGSWANCGNGARMAHPQIHSSVLKQTRQIDKLKTEKKRMNDCKRSHSRCHSSHCRTTEADGCTGDSHTKRFSAPSSSSLTCSAISIVSLADTDGNCSSSRSLPMVSISFRISLMSSHISRVATSGRSVSHGSSALSTCRVSEVTVSSSRSQSRSFASNSSSKSPRSSRRTVASTRKAPRRWGRRGV